MYDILNEYMLKCVREVWGVLFVNTFTIVSKLKITHDIQCELNELVSKGWLMWLCGLIFIYSYWSKPLKLYKEYYKKDAIIIFLIFSS